jgi:hypothetical protein
VWVVFTDYVADNACRLLVSLVVIVAQLAHRIEDTPMNRFEAVTHIRQRTPDDDAHRVVEIGLLHLLFETYRQQFLCNFSHKYSQTQRDSGHRAESNSDEKLWIFCRNNY